MESLNRKTPGGLDPLGNSYRVLVVDDSSTIRRLAGQMLRAEAFEVCGEASDGAMAVDAFARLKPHAVTLDINMPVMDGLETLRRLLVCDPDARVVMVSSEGHKDLVIEAMKLGARGYVVKPFTKAGLCTKVREAIKAV